MSDEIRDLIIFFVIMILVISTLVAICIFTTPKVTMNPIDHSTNTIEIIKPAPAPHYQVTSEEREMLARLVYLESSICSLECQKAVVSVVFNRLDSGKWGNSLREVVYYKNAFSPVDKIVTTTPNETAYEAVDYIIQYGSILPPEVRYFRVSYDFNWQDYKNYCVIDNVYFGYLSSWEQGAW